MRNQEAVEKVTLSNNFLTVSLHFNIINPNVWDVGNLGPVHSCPSLVTFAEN